MITAAHKFEEGISGLLPRCWLVLTTIFFFFKGLITFQRSQRGQKEDKEVFSFPIELKNQGNNWKLKLPPENFLQLKILYVLAAKPIRFLSTCIPLANVVSVVTHFPLLRNGRK